MEASAGTLELLSSVERLGMLGLLAVAVVALVKEWIVPGARLRKAEEQREKAELAATELVKATELITGIGETIEKALDTLPSVGAYSSDRKE